MHPHVKPPSMSFFFTSLRDVFNDKEKSMRSSPSTRIILAEIFSFEFDFVRTFFHEPNAAI